jgi:hypothetical protein
MMNYDHSLFWRTRRAISAGGFFTTIHSITDVAAARAYLKGGFSKVNVRFGGHETCVGSWGTGIGDLPCKDILCMIISKVDFRWSPNWDASRLSIPGFQ